MKYVIEEGMRSYALQKVSEHGLNLKDCPEIYRDDEEIGRIAITSYPEAAMWLSERLQNDKELFFAAYRNVVDIYPAKIDNFEEVVSRRNIADKSGEEMLKLFKTLINYEWGNVNFEDIDVEYLADNWFYDKIVLKMKDRLFEKFEEETKGFNNNDEIPAKIKDAYAKKVLALGEELLKRRNEAVASKEKETLNNIEDLGV